MSVPLDERHTYVCTMLHVLTQNTKDGISPNLCHENTVLPRQRLNTNTSKGVCVKINIHIPIKGDQRVTLLLQTEQHM